MLFDVSVSILGPVFGVLMLGFHFCLFVFVVACFVLLVFWRMLKSLN